MRTGTMIVITLGQFVRDEMKRRDITSNREFARLAGINHEVINGLVNDKGIVPELSTILRLSNYTGASLVTLLALAFPDAIHIDVDPQALIDAEKISKLPPEKQAIARGYISDAYAQSGDK